MYTRIDVELLEQFESFRLKYSCEYCGHYDHVKTICSLGYPEQPHRLRVLEVGQQLLFCKEFDLV